MEIKWLPDPSVPNQKSIYFSINTELKNAADFKKVMLTGWLKLKESFKETENRLMEYFKKILRFAKPYRRTIF